ncbi:MAG TPA: hypothetical protein PK657_10255 [Legionella sp.]|nr:hypothetical protein [Legionella sp.]
MHIMDILWDGIFASMDLLRVFVEEIESQCIEIPEKFVREQKFYRQGNDEVTVHKGLDDMTWSLDEVFINYFPNLFRKSALLTLYGEFENLLNNLCNDLKKEKKLKLSFNDMSDRGIDRARKYLEKVAGIKVVNQSSWEKIKQLQELRNLIAHNNGLVKDKEKYYNIKENFPHLSGETEIILHAGFLEAAVEIFISYFKEIKGKC